MNVMDIDSSVFFNLCCKLVIVECSPTKGIVELVWKPITKPLSTYRSVCGAAGLASSRWTGCDDDVSIYDITMRNYTLLGLQK